MISKFVLVGFLPVGPLNTSVNTSENCLEAWDKVVMPPPLLDR